MLARSSSLRSPRLRLVPCPARIARLADVGGGAAVEEALGISVDPSWPPADLREILLGYAESLEEEPALLGWGLWLILDRSGETLVGDIGFKGPPDLRGEVELGYGIVAPFRRRGLVTEAIHTLLDWAWDEPAVERISARCFATNFASIGVLEKIGFHRTGEVGGILEWELHRSGE